MGEQLGYAITDRRCAWLGVRVFCAASRRLRARDRWIGWTEEQRRRRLPLRVNNCRFLLLPHKTFPNLASQALGLSLDRLSSDWQARYDHPVVLVETVVDPELRMDWSLEPVGISSTALRAPYPRRGRRTR